MWDTNMYPNFTAEELRCQGTGAINFHPGFMEALQALRTELGEPMTITSGCRATAHNANVGGNPRSLHICDQPQHKGQLGTLAVDVASTGGPYRGRLFALAWKHGFSIGWNAKRGFLHLDRRDMVGLKQTSFDY